MSMSKRCVLRGKKSVGLRRLEERKGGRERKDEHDKQNEPFLRVGQREETPYTYCSRPIPW